MKSSNVAITGIAFVTITAFFAFQNCSENVPKDLISLNSEASTQQGYVEISSASAKSMILGSEGLCAANQYLVPTMPSIRVGTGYIAGSYPNAKGTTVAFISGSGNTMLFHEGAGTGRVNSITGVSGNVMLCGFDVGTITGSSSGDVILDGGEVEMISGFTGNLALIGVNGFPASIENFHGTIVIKTNSGAYKGRTYDVE